MTRTTKADVNNAFARLMSNMQRHGVDTTRIMLDHAACYGGYTLVEAQENGGISPITGGMMNMDRVPAGEFVSRVEFYCKMADFVAGQK